MDRMSMMHARMRELLENKEQERNCLKELKIAKFNVRTKTGEIKKDKEIFTNGDKKYTDAFYLLPDVANESLHFVRLLPENTD